MFTIWRTLVFDVIAMRSFTFLCFRFLDKPMPPIADGCGLGGSVRLIKSSVPGSDLTSGRIDETPFLILSRLAEVDGAENSSSLSEMIITSASHSTAAGEKDSWLIEFLLELPRDGEAMDLTEGKEEYRVGVGGAGDEVTGVPRCDDAREG